MSKQEKEVKALLNQTLTIGDSRSQVEEKLKTIDIEFSYDRFQNRYQATVTGCGKFEALSVYLSLDDENKLSKIDVAKSYTGL